MSDFSYERRKRKRIQPVYIFILSLLITFSFAGCFLYYSSQKEYQTKLEHANIYGQYFSHKTKLTFENFAQSLQVLASVITWQNGKTDFYEEIAGHLIKIIPETLNINLAKDGIVSHVFPYEQNKKALGHNLLANKERKDEAMLALTTREITVSGPFDLIQGGRGLAFRQAIFLPKDAVNEKKLSMAHKPSHEPSGSEYFWGFALITYDFPQILTRLNFEDLSQAGLSYNLWRFSPVNGEQETIIASETPLDKNMETYTIPIQNATWYLNISPVSGWLNIKHLIVHIVLYGIICILLSMLVTAVIILKTKNKIIQRQNRTDSLTNLPNRKWSYTLLQQALLKHQNAKYNQGDPVLFVCMVDFNDFKHINDTYGHHVGDQLLIEFSKRISNRLLPGEFAARLGGDEFLAIFYCEKKDDGSIPDRLQEIQNYLQLPYLLGEISCIMTVSIGFICPDKDILDRKPPQQTNEEFFVDLADKVMYLNKKKYYEGKEHSRGKKEYNHQI